MNTAQLKERFAGVTAVENIVSDAEQLVEHATDYTEESARTPGLVLLPTSVDEVQAIVRIANEIGCSLTPKVTGSNVGGLAIAPEGGVIVDLHKMNRIVEVNAEDMVAVIEPGVTWEQLAAHLDDNDIPLRMGYPLSPPDTSIMANCLLDGLGNLSMRYGAMADWIGGLEAVLPDGSLIKTGAAALSDIWFGRAPLPDLTGLFVSFQGTTGIVTKMAFQLWPKPPFRQRMFLLTGSRNDAFAAMHELTRNQICDDVGGLSWPTGKMVFGVQRPVERDPGEPEFFLYLDVSGQSERELKLRLDLLNDLFDRMRRDGHKLEKPLAVETLVALVPRLAKLATFPTRLDFLIDHPGGGLTWVGTYGPMSRFKAYADRAAEIMDRYKFPPAIVSRPMKGGHFGVMRFLATFDKKDDEERAALRDMNRELVDAALELGFVPYKTPPWVVEHIRSKLDRGFKDVLQKVRKSLDPNGIMSPHCWPLSD